VTPLLFPDNTVLINFALINRADLLARIANSNGRWCGTVARECARSALEPGLGDLQQMPEIFGEPLRPETGAEHIDVGLLRDDLAQPGDEKHQHLGEAETLAIMLRRNMNGIFVTDDKSATRLAASRGVRTATTWGLLRLAVTVKLIDADTAWGYVQVLRGQGRGSPPGVFDRRTFDRWLDPE
jgi:predicted nucleic acid-binding protein